MGRLNALAVTRAKKPGRHSDGGGLVLQVSRDGVKSWIYRFMIDGHEREMGLGSVHDVTLKEAREKAADARKLKSAGIDPINQKAATRAAARLASAKGLTFEAAATRYIASHRAGWRNAEHARQWPATLSTYVYPIIGALPVGAIDTAAVLRALEPIWTEKTETASRLRGRIESVLDWATAQGFRTGDNPARLKGNLDHLLPDRTKVAKVQHHIALPYPELPAFMAQLHQLDGAATRALEFTILTAARAGEVMGARWNEINMGPKTWTIPPERMKANKAHRVPLSDGALTALGPPSAADAFLFAGRKRSKPLLRDSMRKVLTLMGNEVTVHGFRSTFRDWCAERTDFASEVVETALAHAVGNKVEAAYRRGDLFERRRELMTAWAAHCAKGV